MNMHLRWTVMVGVGLCLGAGCSSTPKPTANATPQITAPTAQATTPEVKATAPEDMASIQGTWTGHDVSDSSGKVSMTITGSALKFQAVGAEEWYAGKLTLRPNTTPKQAEVFIENCSVPNYVKQTAKAIYKLEGNTLTIAATEPGAEAGPSSFEPSNQARVFVFSRP